MKKIKILNLLSYFSLLLIPILLLAFICILHNPVKIITCIGLVLIIFMQIKHYKKTKIKNIGIRILTTILLTIIFTLIIHNTYGAIKNIEGIAILNKIEKIQFKGITLEKEDLKSAILIFVNEKHMISKGISEATIYYIDDNVENVRVIYPGRILIIKGNMYYIRNVPKLDNKLY